MVLSASPAHLSKCYYADLAIPTVKLYCTIKDFCQSEKHFRAGKVFLSKRAVIRDNRGSPLSVSKKVSGNPGVLLQASAPCHERDPKFVQVLGLKKG